MAWLTTATLLMPTLPLQAGDTAPTTPDRTMVGKHVLVGTIDRLDRISGRIVIDGVVYRLPPGAAHATAARIKGQPSRLAERMNVRFTVREGGIGGAVPNTIRIVPIPD